MSYARVHSAGLSGAAGTVVEIEADVAEGLPNLVLSGLPDAALQEARDRVRAAIVNSGERWPQRRMTVNLRPATMRKQGSSFDVAIAVALLGGTGTLPLAALEGAVLIGELGLDGAVRGVPGVLPMVIAAARAGLRRAIVPAANASEAALVPGVQVRAADSLSAVLRFIRDGFPLGAATPRTSPQQERSALDLADVVGQDHAKLALEVAAAGGHHLSLLGPPGAGKTMLAQRMPTILPPLDDAAAMEVTSLYSIAGRLSDGGLLRTPPFQAPHHTTSVSALVGGGNAVARPGALSLAHRGVLFLDELPEFGRHALETLRQPLEEGVVRLGRAYAMVTYPARVQLITAANPCPCARPGGDQFCECAPGVRQRYLNRLSGPLMDRIDIQVELYPVSSASLFGASAGDDSQTTAARVADARCAAAERWSAYGWRSNAEASRDALALPPGATRDLRHRIDAGVLSARGYVRVLRVAWSLADLAGRPSPHRDDVNTALGLRIGGLG